MFSFKNPLKVVVLSVKREYKWAVWNLASALLDVGRPTSSTGEDERPAATAGLTYEVSHGDE